MCVPQVKKWHDKMSAVSLKWTDVVVVVLLTDCSDPASLSPTSGWHAALLCTLGRLKIHCCSFVSFSNQLAADKQSSSCDPFATSPSPHAERRVSVRIYKIKVFMILQHKLTVICLWECCWAVSMTLPVAEISAFQNSLSVVDFVLEQHLPAPWCSNATQSLQQTHLSSKR